ncbi:MAG: MarR family winged helix-turn-helix transcriptional regulator [Gammaproteobacteria bacterium]|nr:MarR family winged helix-turn-helix transcriptional regulator [Gammaproteobacteria bacterium]
MSRYIASAYSERFGLTIPQWRVIAILGEGIEQTSKGLVDLTKMDKVAVSRAVSQLVTKKLVRRIAVQTDGRLALVRLSKQGKDLYEEISPLALDLERKLLDQLSDQEIQDLHKILDKLGHSVPEIQV